MFGSRSTEKVEPPSKATNPFFIFLHEFRQNLLKRGCKNLNVKQIACMAGEKWRQMSANEKLTYVVWARKNRQQADPRLKAKTSGSKSGGSGTKGCVSKKKYQGRGKSSYIS